MQNFAITGVAGYVAPRHLNAIRDTGNRLVAAVDPHDSVGILDRFFADVAFFTEFERFDRHLEKLAARTEDERVHWLSASARPTTCTTPTSASPCGWAPTPSARNRWSSTPGTWMPWPSSRQSPAAGSTPCSSCGSTRP